MVPSRLGDKARELRSSIGRQRGFTLVELVAVMACRASAVLDTFGGLKDRRD